MRLISTFSLMLFLFLISGYDAFAQLNVSYTANDNTICVSERECKCHGKLTSITLLYHGDSGVNIKVYNKKNFRNQSLITTITNVQDGQVITISNNGNRKLGSHTFFWIGGTRQSSAVEIKTDCGQINIGVSYGPYTVIGYTDKEGNTCNLMRCDGSIDLTVTGGTPPYTYRWNNGGTSQNQYYLCAGEYTVEVKDNAGKKVKLKIRISVSRAACDDDNLCTIERCYKENCKYTPLNCDDHEICTVDECNNGECLNIASCDDDNLCTNDFCRMDGGSHGHGRRHGDNSDEDLVCFHHPMNCNDDNLCTTDECINGLCRNAWIVCDDGDPCTFDACNDSQCSHTPNDCNDNNNCTVDNCTNGQCENITTISCDDSNPCTRDDCANGQCSNALINCDDYNACTVDECDNGHCSNIPLSCDDSDLCTADNCSNGLCLNIIIPGCGNPCFNINCTDNDACTNDECISGQCVFHPLVCDDNNSCTHDGCEYGHCLSIPINCDDQNPCTTDQCATGECVHASISGCGDLCANSNLIAYAAGSGPNPCNACNGSAFVDITGGTSPYTIRWSNGETTSSIGESGQGASTSICINAGGVQYLSSNGEIFLDDQYYNPGSPGSVAFINNSIADIQGTINDMIYLSERNAAPAPDGNGTMAYNIPVTNGLYDVDLHFAELYFGVETTVQPFTGRRVFDVLIEGALVMDKYDINAEVGPATAIIKSFTTNVADGKLDIQFISVINRAKVSAICVKPHPVQAGDGLCAGTYSVTVTDGNGCTASSVVEFCADPCANVNCDDNNPCSVDQCNGGQCDHIAISCDDGTDCTVDACSNGDCTHTNVFAAVVSGNSPSPCDACNGTATVNLERGTAPFTYLWSTGATTQSIGNSSTGNGRKCLNAGGSQYISFSNDTFAADNYFSGTSFVYANNMVAGISGTLDDPLFRSERNTTGTMVYSIPASNGQYEVELYFAELYYGVTGGLQDPIGGIIGKRVFDVYIEGALVLNDYDINKEVGPATADIRTFTTIVSGGSLDIQFTSVINRAKVSAICIKPYIQSAGLCAGPYSVMVIDANGCTASGEVNLCSANKLSEDKLSVNNSIQSLGGIGDLNVYPIPFDKILMFDFDAFGEGEAQIRIVDMLGQVINSQTVEFEAGKNKGIIKIEDGFAEGMYFMEFRDMNNIQYIKLYKSR